MKSADKSTAISGEAIRNIIAAAVYYGFEAQARQCMEECGELIAALNKMLRKSSGGQGVLKTQEELRRGVIEELADVYIMLNEMFVLLDSTDEVIDMVEAKARRTIERMREN